MSVVTFPTQEPTIWVCDCGCSTFNLQSDGEAVCANCEAYVVGAGGGWHEKIADAGEYQGGVAPFNDVQGNGSVDFARARVARMAGDEDIALAVLVRDDGTLHAWCAAETKDQADWAVRRLEQAKDLLMVKDRQE